MTIKVTRTALAEVLILEPQVFGDERGFFFESYNQRTLASLAGITYPFVQDNHSRSGKNVLRGLHYQIQQAQGKLVRAVAGAVFDVAADIRRNSQDFGKWVGVELTAENRQMLWIPPGFAHGFLVLSEYAEVLYKTTQFRAPEFERTIAWNDPDLGIQWPLSGEPVMSAKDRAGVLFKDAEVFE